MMVVADVLFLACAALSLLTISLADSFDVTQYGGVGDGKTDDTQAFLKAWDATCGARGGSSTLKVPGGKTFFINPLMFKGPCGGSAINVQIDGNLVAPSSRHAWENCPSNTWIVFHSVNSLILQGAGTLDAKGSAWWDFKKDNNTEDDDPYTLGGGCYKPTTFRLVSCDSSKVTGLHFLNSGGNHVTINNCKNLHIDKINIKAPESSPNTDGINLSGSSYVMITNSTIGTGDDCIALGNDNFHFNISDITCGPGHGISVGSLGQNGQIAAVDGIYVERCTFIKTLSSARIKTWQGGRGFVRNIYYDHLTLNSVYSAIEINQFYPATKGKKFAVKVSGVHFTKVHGSGQRIRLHCSDDVPCEKIFVQNMNVTSALPRKEVEVLCKNAKVISSNVTPKLPC